MRFGKKMMIKILPYSVFAIAAIMLGAPLAPYILGRQYADITEALRWLALLPALKTLHFFTADALTGSGHQGTRTLIQIGVAGFNVLINLWLIPAYGWRGAAWSSIASDALLALSLLLVVTYLGGKSQIQVEPLTATTAMEASV
jgi:O-antigen/teichoic acid export membrane protein